MTITELKAQAEAREMLANCCRKVAERCSGSADDADLETQIRQLRFTADLAEDHVRCAREQKAAVSQ